MIKLLTVIEFMDANKLAPLRELVVLMYIDTAMVDAVPVTRIPLNVTSITDLAVNVLAGINILPDEVIAVVPVTLVPATNPTLRGLLTTPDSNRAPVMDRLS